MSTEFPYCLNIGDVLSDSKKLTFVYLKGPYLELICTVCTPSQFQTVFVDLVCHFIHILCVTITNDRKRDVIGSIEK